MAEAGKESARGAAGRNLLSNLNDAEQALAHPSRLVDLEQAVAKLEVACRNWPALLSCLTDSAAWDALGAQIKRLERLAEAGQETSAALRALNGASRGYTDRGEPAATPAQPARINCQG